VVGVVGGVLIERGGSEVSSCWTGGGVECLGSDASTSASISSTGRFRDDLVTFRDDGVLFGFSTMYSSSPPLRFDVWPVWDRVSGR